MSDPYVWTAETDSILIYMTMNGCDSIYISRAIGVSEAAIFERWNSITQESSSIPAIIEVVFISVVDFISGNYNIVVKAADFSIDCFNSLSGLHSGQKREYIDLLIKSSIFKAESSHAYMPLKDYRIVYAVSITL
jgi:hypothetical protein